MATIQDLKKYVNYEFSSGCYTGEDYKSFQTKYINYLYKLPSFYLQTKPLATCERRKKSLLLFGVYQKCRKQVRLRIHIRRQILF